MIILPEAEADMANARDWYERQRGGLGAAFLLGMEEVLDRIRRTPEMHAAVHQNVRRAFTRRFPYTVYYRIEGDQVVVVGVFHAGRDPREWQSRA
jgi:plasmid stabilization system protein ParE